MKNKRVGIISMGIVLIGFGALIFISQINKQSAVELAMKFWPMILLLLGGEILWFSFKNKDEDIKIKYDVFSIFIVMIVLSVNIGIYGLIETGVMDWIKTKITSQTYNYDLTSEEHVVDEAIKKIIIKGPRDTNLSIRTSKENKIISSGSININIDGEEKAREVSAEDYININKSGNTMYVEFKDRRNYNYNLYNLNIIIPADKAVEVIGSIYLDLVLDDISNDWIVDDSERVKVRINKDSNMKLKTMVNNEENLKGNTKWTTTQSGNEESPIYNGELIYGDGSNILNILNCYEVTVDEI